MESGLRGVPGRKIGPGEVKKPVTKLVELSRPDVFAAWAQGVVMEAVEDMDRADTYFRSCIVRAWGKTE